HLDVLDVVARIGKEIVNAGMIPVHVRDDDVLHLVRLDAQRLQAFADRIEQLAIALLLGDFVEARVHHESAVGSFDHPDVIDNRAEHVVRIAEDIILRRAPFVTSIADGINFVDVVAHDFLPPIVTPARVSTICTIAVKSLSPPYSAFVVSHWSSTASITACGEPRPLASSKQSRTSLSINAVPNP